MKGRFEGIIPNAGDAVAYNHARQAAATKEGSFPNADDTIRDCHTRKAGATLKG
jgi:hypothetical protein